MSDAVTYACYSDGGRAVVNAGYGAGSLTEVTVNNPLLQ